MLFPFKKIPYPNEIPSQILLFQAPNSTTAEAFDKLKENNLGKTLFSAPRPA